VAGGGAAAAGACIGGVAAAYGAGTGFGCMLSCKEDPFNWP
jgi:hypothetical protein